MQGLDVLVGLYQHVWSLSAAANRALRSATWHKLQQIVTATPARHQLIIAGDVNATLKSRHPRQSPLRLRTPIMTGSGRP